MNVSIRLILTKRNCSEFTTIALWYQSPVPLTDKHRSHQKWQPLTPNFQTNKIQLPFPSYHEIRTASRYNLYPSTHDLDIITLCCLRQLTQPFIVCFSNKVNFFLSAVSFLSASHHVQAFPILENLSVPPSNYLRILLYFSFPCKPHTLKYSFICVLFFLLNIYSSIHFTLSSLLPLSKTRACVFLLVNL